MGTNQRHLTLMCRNHPVAEFVWDTNIKRAVGSLKRLDASFVPEGAKDRRGDVSKSSLSGWINGRSIPALRPDAKGKIRLLGFKDATDMLTFGRGLSLSDQYWLRQPGDNSTWEAISPYTNAFSPHLGAYLIARGDDTISRLASVLSKERASLGASPDASLGGNLTKRWVIEDGARLLLKGGSDRNRLQEPVNEVIATRLAQRLLVPGDYVSYTLRDDYPDYVCACGCMCDDSTELVPAYHILGTLHRRNDESLCDAFVRAGTQRGINLRQHIEKMLVLDHILCNTDRHWNNFGVLMDTETRRWLRPAPIFDNGNALWCDRRMNEGFGSYHMPLQARRPFLTHEYDQLERYCCDLSWFDPHGLDGFVEELADLLRLCPPVAYEKGRLDAVVHAVAGRIDHVIRWAATCARSGA